MVVYFGMFCDRLERMNVNLRLLCIGIILAVSQVVSAQECLMESRLLMLDFGTDAAPAHEFIMGTSRYEEANGGCPNDGSYSFASASNACFEGRWLFALSDHTPGDKNGRMLIVNASPDPKRLFQLPINSLKGGRRYEFSFAIANLLRRADNCEPTQPEIVVKVETQRGAPIARFSTGTIAQKNTFSWDTPRFQFILPEKEDGVVIRIENNVPGGCGNDFAMDDFMLKMCREKQLVEVLTQSSNPGSSQKNKPRIILEQRNTTLNEEKVSVQALPISPVKPQDSVRVIKPDVPSKSVPAEINPSSKSAERPLMKDWNLRSNPLAGEIILKEPGTLTLEVFDADQVDGDTISLLLNRKFIFNKAGLTETPLTTSISLNERGATAEVLLIAENLGKIPPNTAKVVVTGPLGLRKELEVRTGNSENAVLRFRLN